MVVLFNAFLAQKLPLLCIFSKNAFIRDREYDRLVSKNIRTYWKLLLTIGVTYFIINLYIQR